MNDEIKYRCELRPGDIGWIVHRHGAIYGVETGYGVDFEAYVAEGLAEFWRAYDASRDRAWIVEFDDRIVGFLLLMHRGETTAQLRYFYLEPEFRGRGIGTGLMERFIDFMKVAGYTSAFLWTTYEQIAAAALYRRFGFELVAEKPSSAFGKELIERRYELNLENL